MPSDKTTMFDRESEEALLAAAYIDATTFDKVGPTISVADFGDRDLGQLWELLGTMHAARIPIGDWQILRPLLDKLQIAEEKTRGIWWVKLAENLPAPWHATYYSKRICDFADRRKLFDLAQGIMAKVDAGEPATETLAYCKQRQTSIQTRGEFEASSLLPIMEERANYFRTMGSQGHNGCMTGLETIDNALGGLFPGELTVVAARTSNGKTALALQIAEHNAEKNRPVLFFSLEMTATELAQRLLCGRTQVDNRDVRKGTVGADDVARLIGETKILAALPLWVWARYGTTLAMIRGLSQIHHSRHGIRMIVVDYIARVKRTDFRMERREFIGEITNGLKDLAKELNVPVLALSQLNREAEGETPSLAMLSESSSVENDADVVLFLHRDREKPETKFIIAKNRHGQTGKFDLYFDGPRTRFLSDRPVETCSGFNSQFRDFNESRSERERF